MEILLVLYCLLLLVSSSYLWLKLRKSFWSIEVLFLLLTLLFYVFIPVNIILFGHKIYEPSIESYMVPASRFVTFSSFFISLAFILSFVLGSAFRGSSLKPIKIYIRKLRFNNINLYKAISYFLAFFSLISLIIFVQQFGGFSSFVTNLQLNRVGILDQDFVGRYTFFGSFIHLAIIPFLYFLYENRKTRMELLFLFFVPIFVLLFSVLFISTAKIKIIILLLVFYFTWSIRENKLYLHYLYLISVVVFLALPVLDEMFVLVVKVFKDEGILAVPFRMAYALFSGSLGQGQYEEFLKDNSQNLYLKSLGYFTYIQMSLQLSIDTSYPLLFFKDILTGVSKLLPSRFNIQPGLEVQQLNTSIFYGYYPVMPDFSAGVPPGIIGFGMYSLSVPGVILLGFTLGYVFRIIDLFFKSLVKVDRRFSSFYAYIICTLGFYSMPGIPKEAIYDYAFLTFLLMFLVVSFKFESLNSEGIRQEN